MQVIRLTPAHADRYRAIMLEAYSTEPDNWTATVSEREPLPLDWWASRLSAEPDATEIVFGAFVDNEIIGVAGLRFERRPKTKHKASLFGMFVRPRFRSRGIARTLVEAVLKKARQTPGTVVVQLTVAEPNVAARRLYGSCGFRPYGIEPLAIKIGKRFISLVHMYI